MPLIPIRIPMIGEGLQEARLVAVLKQPGDPVRRDEPIYQMETDKAVMDVESPYEGTLVRWAAEPDTVLAIGAEVAFMEVEGVVETAAPTHGAPAASPTAPAPPVAAVGARNAAIPPRTRAYAKERGVSDEDLAAIPAEGGKLMPSDIDAYLARSAQAAYDERPVSAKQRLLASRLVRGSQLVVPGTMSMVVEWSDIEHRRQAAKLGGGDFQPSAFTMFAFAVAQALRDFPTFRSSLVGDDKVRTYRHAALGIAVGLPGDELVLAVVDDADALGWREFANQMRAKIELARSGKDQATEAVTLSLTNMQSFGIRDAVPVVVPPAVATLFLGEVYVGPNGRTVANISMTFDHRIANGVGAAQFMQAIRERVENLSLE